jgi:hypothetical protein
MAEKKVTYADELKAMSDADLNKQEEMLGKSLHLIPFIIVNLPIDSIVRHPDWQPRLRTDPTRLFNSICLNGLSTPMVISIDMQGVSDGVPHLLTGNHRFVSLEMIRDTRPLVWKRHQFDKGVPCKVYRGLTTEQILDLRTDEGRSQEPLAGKAEAFRALLPHYERGRTDNEIQGLFWKIFADCCCSSSIRATLYEKFRTMKDPRDFMVAIHNATYVHQQLFRNLFRCPKVIQDAWVNGEAGLLDESGVAALKLTTGNIKDLAKAHFADCKDDEVNGFTRNINKDNMGDGCKALFTKLMTEKASGTPETKDKPMTATDRNLHITNGKSAIEKIIFSAIQGNPTSQARLDDTLNIVGRYEAAMNIDRTTIDEVILAITQRATPLDEATRQEILTAIRGTKKAPKPVASGKKQ